MRMKDRNRARVSWKWDGFEVLQSIDCGYAGQGLVTNFVKLIKNYGSTEVLPPSNINDEDAR